MTIGIATYGPNAGAACVAALKSVEAVGRGAIGGFVSLVVITQDGDLKHLTCQTEGTRGLLQGANLPIEFAQAELATLMSSGPNRPEPLESFTVAKAGVALVTGHRMPNAIGVSGKALNQSVLDLIETGHEPHTAMSMILTENPNADAGFLVLTADRKLFTANSALVEQRSDTGLCVLDDPATELGAGVIHNGILPSKPLASLAAEVAMDHMCPADAAYASIEFRTGTRLSLAESTYVEVDEHGVVAGIFVDDPLILMGTRGVGLGYKVPVVKSVHSLGHMTYEPFLLVTDGVLSQIDGNSALAVSIRRDN